MIKRSLVMEVQNKTSNIYSIVTSYVSKSSSILKHKENKRFHAVRPLVMKLVGSLVNSSMVIRRAYQ